ncbi:MAG: arylsulfatase [Carboxylicivirga sp.]|jgi:arylsulfatase A-like enzyme|nr:arylsulfatase [Carboxylicivirga sp.]
MLSLFKHAVSLMLLMTLLLSCCKDRNKKTTVEKELPNIVYILADDLGYGDLTALNAKSGVSTPNMDSIVENGIYFSDAHSNSSVCTPTRYGILTGRYAWRSRLKEGVTWGYSLPLIGKEQITVASFLSTNGYQTACIGKWHLGLEWQAKDKNKPIRQVQWSEVLAKGEDSNVDFSHPVSGPNTLGFDYSYIIPASLDMAPYVYIENDLPTALPTAYTNGKDQAIEGRGVFWRAGEMAPDFDFYNVLSHFTDKAVAYIQEQSKNKKPFFLYFPLTAPHTPWLPTEEVKGKSQAGRYGDFVKMVDNTIGEVMASLKKSGQLENTLVIVTSDNGSHWIPEDMERYVHRANYVFRGYKADIYEGGHHVPYIAQWPERIKAGSHSKQTICTTDLIATLAGMLNVELPNHAGVDSYNLWPAYIGEDHQSIRDYTIHHSVNGSFAIRQGKWKLNMCSGSAGWSYPNPETIEKDELDLPQMQLFDLETDLVEKNNIAAKYPEKVKELRMALLKIIRDGRSTEGTLQQNDVVGNWLQLDKLKKLENSQINKE